MKPEEIAVKVKQMFDRLDQAMQFPQKKQPTPTFKDAFTELEEFNKFVYGLVCPSCRKSGDLKVVDYERGGDGWGSSVTCVCGFKGVVNPSGFRAVYGEPTK